MEIGILIPLIIVILILLFSGSRQRRALRQTETRLRDTLLKQQSTFRQTETRLRDALLEQQSTFRQTETRLRDTLLEKIEEVEHLLKRYHRSTLFDYQSPWWQDYSWLYRHVRGWQCEECQLSLNLDRQYLHTHHISGTQHNDPNDLKGIMYRVSFRTARRESSETRDRKMTITRLWRSMAPSGVRLENP